MAIANFIPEVWSAALLKALRDTVAYAQVGVINRNYEGDIARAGDTVHITDFGDPQVRSYSKYATDDQEATPSVTYDVLDDDTRSLVVDQADYFAFAVDDIDRRQALPGFVDEATRGAGANMAYEVDDYVGGLMVANAGNDLGSLTVADPKEAYSLLVQFRTKLVRSNTPDAGRWVIVPPEFYALLLEDDRFIRADAAGTTSGLRNGQVGRAAGFDVIEANRAATDSGGEHVLLAGHGIATTFANQISNVEALRLQGHFADGIRGLQLYGAKVLRPDNLAKATVTIDTDGS